MKDITKLSEKEYRAYDCESFSSIKYLLESAQDYKYYKAKAFKGNAATLLGTCVHHYIQGNQHLVAFQPYPALKKNAELIAKFEEKFRELAGEDGIIVPKALEEKLLLIHKNFKEHPLATKLIEGCEIEKAFLFNIDGVALKGKVDGIKGNSIVEIKSSSGAKSQMEFKEEAKERHYDMQAFMYQEAARQNGYEIENHYFIVANTSEPYKIAVYKSTQEFLLGGKRKAAKVVENYKRYIINGEEEVKVEHDGEL